MSNEFLGFLVKDTKFARFYLLGKVHKRLNDVPGRPVTSTCGYYTETIFSFLNYHLPPQGQKVKWYIKDTNHFLSKLQILERLPQGVILCSIDIVGLYPNISHSEGLTSLRRFLELRDNKQISRDTHIELAEIVLKATFLNSMKTDLNRYMEPQL